MGEVTSQRVAFIDRDGVINEERHYVHRAEDFVLLPGVLEGLRLLQEAGFRLVIVTNQAGIGRGLYSEAQFQALTHHMCGLLASAGIAIAAVYHCPHHPTHGVGDYRVDCDCRKPKPGMLIAAQRDLGVDFTQAVLIGDKRSDIEAGRAAGVARCVLVTSGHAVSEADRHAADAVCCDLREAASFVVK